MKKFMQTISAVMFLTAFGACGGIERGIMSIGVGALVILATCSIGYAVASAAGRLD